MRQTAEKHDEAAFKARIETEISAVGRAAWDACANPTPGHYDPFVSFDFLSALEESGCVSAQTGWLAQHIALEDDDGAVLGLVPCYLKSHSQGEYVFDYGWADAFERAGGQYYPKLQCSVPFTPVTGRKFLLPAQCDDEEGRRMMLLSAAVQLTERHEASSFHATFVSQAEQVQFERIGLLVRTDQQFHWQNDGYSTFDDFLAALSSRKRKTIRRERREAQAAGLQFQWLQGRDITEAHWDAFFDFYQDTGSRKWGSPYLNREFFSLIGERMADRILLVMVKRDDSYIAGALNFIGSDTLYGRYWGCTERVNCLHFEVCYYQAMEFAITQKLARVEAGAQGEHKLARGYGPVLTHSVHYIANPGFRDAVAQFLVRERDYVDRVQGALVDYLPFRKG